MAEKKLLQNIFRKGSRTYYNSSRFFPPDIRSDISALYAFVRVADDFVDAIPQNRKGFQAFCNETRQAFRTGQTRNKVIFSFLKLSRRKKFPDSWRTAFLGAMATDLKKREYLSMNETVRYMYGSAEVIGLFMCRIMGLDRRAERSARMLGRSMQYINFIRDVQEDAALGRIYLPASERKKFGLKALDSGSVQNKEKAFCSFMRKQVVQYREWQAKAEEGFRFIPRSFLIPIRTASDAYQWTADRIFQDPMVVYRRKVKPSRLRIFLFMLLNFFRPAGRS